MPDIYARISLIIVLYLQHDPRHPAEIDFPKFSTEKCTVSFMNTHHDVTDLVNYGMFKNSKT